jgi:CheY-like chemotaxis protein
MRHAIAANFGGSASRLETAKVASVAAVPGCQRESTVSSPESSRIGANALHVLVVDNDTTVLDVVCKRLITEGHNVSTARRAQGIDETISRIHPDIVLIDVLMPDFNTMHLSRLLGRYPKEGTPAMILHSPVPPRALRSMLDVSNALGIVQKTTNDLEFFFSFNSLIDQLVSGRSGMLEELERTMSGTHRIGREPRFTPELLAKTSPGRR